jgi:3-hydroxyacyl-CoA dehydrogenase/enoyl-CoA hydratase/3-hydroxybutyryl-CoA epimerase
MPWLSGEPALMPYLNEATICLQEGAATAQEIDDAMTAYGWPMGPFTLMDFLGLDVCYDVGEYLYSQYGERMKGAVMFEKLYQAGRYGEKVGAGFYGYGDDTDEPVKAIVAELTSGQKLSEFTPERLMYPLIIEAAYAVQENIADVRDIDMAMIAGTGMTVGGERMGPLVLADKLGLDVVVAGLEAFERNGLRFIRRQFQVGADGHLHAKTRAAFGIRLVMIVNQFGTGHW